MNDFLSQFNKQQQINKDLFENVLKNEQINPGQGQNINPAQTQGQMQGQVPKKQKKVPLQFERYKLYSFNLEKLPIIGQIAQSAGKDILLMFNSPNDFQNFKAILYYINSGFFENDINTVQKAIKYGEVQGYGPHTYLSSVFNNVQGNVPAAKKGGLKEAGVFSGPKFTMPSQSTVVPATKPVKKSTQAPQQSAESFDTASSMTRLEKFVRYFVENIVDKDRKPNNTVKRLIINRLKSVLGTKKFKAPEAPKAPEKPKTTATTTAATKTEPGTSGDEGDIEDIIGQAKLKESYLRKNIRNIINDTF